MLASGPKWEKIPNILELAGEATVDPLQTAQAVGTVANPASTQDEESRQRVISNSVGHDRRTSWERHHIGASAMFSAFRRMIAKGKSRTSAAIRQRREP